MSNLPLKIFFTAMTLPINITVPAFDSETEPSLAGLRWTNWLQRIENYSTVLNITGDGSLKALLLHLAGETVYDIHETLSVDADKYADVKQKLTNYFSPKKKTCSTKYIYSGKHHSNPVKTLMHIRPGFICKLKIASLTLLRKK